MFNDLGTLCPSFKSIVFCVSTWGDIDILQTADETYCWIDTSHFDFSSQGSTSFFSTWCHIKLFHCRIWPCLRMKTSKCVYRCQVSNGKHATSSSLFKMKIPSLLGQVWKKISHPFIRPAGYSRCLPSNAFQLLLGDPEAFPHWMGYIIPPARGISLSIQLGKPRKKAQEAP